MKTQIMKTNRLMRDCLNFHINVEQKAIVIRGVERISKKIHEVRILNWTMHNCPKLLRHATFRLDITKQKMTNRYKLCIDALNPKTGNKFEEFYIIGKDIQLMA
ncbi:MAG: hypothetical protein MK193_06400 [Lentisphaeria bacterium]|nr:hypothetical protein [Lentisphaeria bacterium]